MTAHTGLLLLLAVILVIALAGCQPPMPDCVSDCHVAFNGSVNPG